MRRVSLAFGLVVVLPWIAAAQPQALSPEAQIAAAVQAAPEDRRAGASVLGYDTAGKLTQLRPGTNDLVCIADNPAAEGISVACYHKDLDAFMARGRELTATGVTDDKVRDATRWKEIESGTLKMPREPRMLYVLNGKTFDPATGAIGNAYERWVLYVPFATADTLGMGTKPTDNEPWLMDAGTAGAHIMISPPRPKP
jgi:hypothetical protein